MADQKEWARGAEQERKGLVAMRTRALRVAAVIASLAAMALAGGAAVRLV